MLNKYILSYLIASLLCMGVMLFVTIKQFNEVRRPKNAFTRLRWYLLLFPLLILLGIALGIPRLVVSLHANLSGGELVARVVGGIVMLIAISLLTLRIYTFREKDK